MDEPLPDGGMIRKSWVGETDAYRNHLLRLDRESRHRRFSGAVSDEFIAQHAASASKLSVVLHGFFVDGVLRGGRDHAADRDFVLSRNGRGIDQAKSNGSGHGVHQENRGASHGSPPF